MMFTSQSEALTWLFLFGFWLVLVYMAMTMKGVNGYRMGVMGFLQLLFSVTIGIGFFYQEPIIAIGVMGTGMIIFLATITK